MALTDNIYVTGLTLHEIKSEILLDYEGDFELNGLMVIGPVEHKTNIRFINMDDIKSYINAIDVDYDSEDVTFTGYVYKLNTHQFNVVKRSAYAKGINSRQKLLKIMDKAVIYQILDGISSNVLNISLIKTIQKIFRIALEVRNMGHDYRLLLEFKHSVESIISTLVALMVKK